MTSKSRIGRPVKLSFDFVLALNKSVAVLRVQDPSLTQKAVLERLADQNLIPTRYLHDGKLKQDWLDRYFLEQYLTPSRIKKSWMQDIERFALPSEMHSAETKWVKNPEDWTGILQLTDDLIAWKAKNPSHY